MKRLEKKNLNTRKYYNKVLLNHFNNTGLDVTDMWRIEWLLGRWKGGKLLDIGCGISPLPIIAASKGEVWAMDFSDELIERLRLGTNRVKYITGDMNKLPFDDKYFDYVVLGEVLEHSENPKRVISEAERVLKDNGIIAVSCPNEEKEHIYKQHIWSISRKDIENMLNVTELDIKSNNILCYAKKK